MKRKITFILLVLWGALLSAFGQSSYDLTGIWMGKMVINEQVSMTIAFEFYGDGHANYQAVMHSLDQGFFDLAVKDIQIENNNVQLTIDKIGVVYEGIIIQEGEIHGHATQGKNKPWTLHLKKVDRLPVDKPNRPQEPRFPYDYQVEEVYFKNEAAGIQLAGTLTLPHSTQESAAIILLAGSGPTDRDATIFGHKYFLVLADQFTKAGYVVLRMDTRGVAESGGDFESAKITDLAQDALAAFDFLKSRAEVDPTKIGFIGHSFGAEKASIAASHSEDVAFVILMAGGAIPLYECIYEQTEAYYGLRVSEKAVQTNTKILKTVFETLKHEPDNEKVQVILEDKFKLMEQDVLSLTQEEQQLLNLRLPLTPAKFNYFMSPTLRYDLFYDPTEAISKLRMPVLAINGTLDIQVLPHNLYGIEKALQEGGNTHFSIKMFEGKNHMFQNATTGSPEEYPEIETTIESDVLDFMKDWLHTHLQK